MGMCAMSSSQLDIIRFDRLSDEEGLPNNLFKQVIQDRDGFLWMSGADGLARYNGYEILSFRHSNTDSFSISGNNITVIFEDSRGRLWIGVIGSGINLSDVQKVKFEYVSVFSDEAKEASLVIYEITEDASGNIWIAANLGLYLIRQDKDVMKAITLQEFLNQPIEGNHHLDDPISLFTDANGKVWIGTRTGLCMYDPVQGHLFTPMACETTSPDREAITCTASSNVGQSFERSLS
jgi:ligand-binding sensor domain-containing protein